MIQPMLCSAQTIQYSQTIPGDEISQNMVIFCSRYGLCILFKAAKQCLVILANDAYKVILFIAMMAKFHVMMNSWAPALKVSQVLSSRIISISFYFLSSSLDLGIFEARDLAQNRPLWRLMSSRSTIHS